MPRLQPKDIFHRIETFSGFKLIVTYTTSEAIAVYLEGELYYKFLKQATIVDMTHQGGQVLMPQALHKVNEVMNDIHRQTDSYNAKQAWKALPEEQKMYALFLVAQKINGLIDAGVPFPKTQPTVTVAS
jgi:hypothetical protein